MTADKGEIIFCLTAPFALVMIVTTMVTGIKEVELKAPHWNGALSRSSNLAVIWKEMKSTTHNRVGTIWLMFVTYGLAAFLSHIYIFYLLLKQKPLSN